MHLLATNDAFLSPVSSVPQCTKANLKCLKKFSPKVEFHKLSGSFLFTRSRYKVCFTGMPRGFLKRVLRLSLFNDLSQHKQVLIDQIMTPGTTCPTLIEQYHVMGSLTSP